MMTKFRMTFVTKTVPTPEPLNLLSIAAQMLGMAILSFAAVSVILGWGGLKVF
ncbi:MAG: hypothetical protein JWL62_3732 [Hyphomicrobiales bacterium]|nr:hypothetical protein [Hyphomicrobiales bacterium]